MKAIETFPKEKCHPHLCSANARNHLPCSLSVRPGTVLLLNVKAAPVHLMRKSMEIWSIDQLFLHLIGHLLRICWECYDIMSWKQLVNCRAKKKKGPLHHPHHLRHPRTFLNLGGSRSSLAETLEMPSDALLFAKPSIIDRCRVPWRQNDQSIGLNWTNQLDTFPPLAGWLEEASGCASRDSLPMAFDVNFWPVLQSDIPRSQPDHWQVSETWRHVEAMRTRTASSTLQVMEFNIVQL